MREVSMAVKSVKELVRDAGKSVEAFSGEAAAKLVGTPGVLFVDVREGEELQKTGRLRGAVHVPRGLLEFQADPSSPTHKPELGGDRKLVLYCGSGGRSALAAKALKDMGIDRVAHVEGGFPALRDAGAILEP
jgi:rhodanese-related sulfurtransferase